MMHEVTKGAVHLHKSPTVSHRLHLPFPPLIPATHNGRIARSGRLAAPFSQNLGHPRALSIRESIPFEAAKRLTLARTPDTFETAGLSTEAGSAQLQAHP